MQFNAETRAAPLSSGQIVPRVNFVRDVFCYFIVFYCYPGDYSLSVWWSGIAVPGMPVCCHARGTDEPINHEKVVISGRGLHSARVLDQADFLIDGSEGGPGKYN